ncbi:Enoyl-CoA hydratase/carnithine racemase [Parafrankia irregularis]|uniref:Enoyl-CoA hydratase/carnithine racemase n=1 Tax=Parafrankia irregularis TaxID=795642 RepID=A0A0S4QVG9_9ACTN|nr:MULTISPECIES: enoyl-CoA hydratase/isomerase family protein [Parafrankia]MBE3199940.1 enoyl-CoA hydratase/isomerase family protein [Parafrankia sp. CH37]CUU59316.1 Enoyl-CoA hydratase/carnithine racemase [Parafrankia irregularis]
MTSTDALAGPVLQRDDGPVRTLTLNRPHRLNAFTAESYRGLDSALRAADRASDVKVVVLTGAGRAFSSGADLRERLETDATGLRQVGAAFESLVLTLADFTKPLIAGVHGAAVGFGMTLLLHCDLVLVADSARLRLPFVELGTAPEAMSSVLLPRRIGPMRAAELLFTARWLTGGQAVEYGLALRDHPEPDLAAATATLAREIARQPAPALAVAKRLLREGHSPTAGTAMPTTDPGRAALRNEINAAVELRAGSTAYKS